MQDKPLIWENHTCMPLRSGHGFMPQLQRYKTSGVNVVSLNTGFDMMDLATSLGVLNFMRDWVEKNEGYAIGHSFQEIERHRTEGKVSVVFDLEGLKGIGHQLDLIRTYYDLGVRWASPVYNRTNQFGGGCMDPDNTGLSTLGRVLVEKMNDTGMVICASHTSQRTSLDLIDASSQPIIFSHSNAHEIHPHSRNITDEQIKACARRGGVVGINGIGIFLGQNDSSLQQFLRHLIHMTELVGVDHVGISLDHVFDTVELEGFLIAHPEVFPEHAQVTPLKMMAPECFAQLPIALAEIGMNPSEIGRVMGGNWQRLAQTVWR